MNDDEFRKLLGDYLDTTNAEMANVELDLMAGCDGFGADHALADHGVTAEEIEQVIYELPTPEQKRSSHDRMRTLFWGCTRSGREITVVAIDEQQQGERRLTLITAFDETEEQWRTR